MNKLHIPPHTPTATEFVHSGEETAATRIMQSSLNELSTLVSGKSKCKQTKATT